jgi:opacity protein-like surface antigen
VQKKSVLNLVLGGALVALPAFSQEEEPLRKSEVTVQALGSFVKSTTNDGIRQGATNSGGVLGSYRYLFNRYNGVEFSYGYTLNTQNYAFPTSSSAVNAYSHEASASYIVRLPLKHWTPFALAGAGALVFDPKDAPTAATQTRPAFVYGAGADFNFTPRIYFRAQYRGLVYNSPNFDLPALGVDRLTHRAEPSAGLGFRF